jgi:hypothetical protein
MEESVDRSAAKVVEAGILLIMGMKEGDEVTKFLTVNMRESVKDGKLIGKRVYPSRFE